MKTGTICTLLLLLFFCNGAASQVKTDSLVKKTGITFSTDFESGSLDSVALGRLAVTAPQRERQTTEYVFDIYSRLDPENPADPKLAPSGRWFYFMMTGGRGPGIQEGDENFWT